MQPKVYPFEEHRIAPDKIDPHANYVIQKLRQNGHIAYLVGGGVRDLLLNQTPKDFDVSTSAKPEEIRSIFRNCILIGRRFRLAHVRFGQKIIEVSTFRSGATEEAGLIVRDNEWGSEEQDVLRRDFTINGLFYDPQSQNVIDYVGGYEDLDKRILKTIGQPDVRFIQDPVRMIRLIKFCARLRFKIHRPTFEALLSCKSEILKSSSARIFEELVKMLESGASKTFYHMLNEYGLLTALTPVLSHYLKNNPNNMTLKLLTSIDEHTIKEEIQLDRAVLISALIFPLFEDALVNKFPLDQKPPHMGQIQELTYKIIDQIFYPFFILPKRTRAIVSMIVSYQYKLNPTDPKFKRPKALKDPIFPYALDLLKIRAKADPTLWENYLAWTQTQYIHHEEPFLEDESKPKRFKRRRRKRN